MDADASRCRVSAPSRPEEDALRRDLERAARVACVRYGLSPAVVDMWGLERLLRELRKAVDQLMQLNTPMDVRSVQRGRIDRPMYAVTPQTARALRRGWTLTKTEYYQC